MPSIFTRLALAAACVGAGVAHAEDYRVDPAHSNVNFEVRHMFSKVNGKFKVYSGDFSFDEKKPEASKVAFTIRAESIDTDKKERDEHLRGPDFFEVAKYPEITFKSKTVKPAGGKKFKLTGDLTMHGKTKPATFDVEFLGADKDPFGREIASFSASTTVNRKDFGMIWNKTTDKGGLLVGDDIKVDVNVEGERPKAAGAAGEPKPAKAEAKKK